MPDNTPGDDLRRLAEISAYLDAHRQQRLAAEQRTKAIRDLSAEINKQNRALADMISGQLGGRIAKRSAIPRYCPTCPYWYPHQD